MSDLLFLASIGGFLAATHWYVSAIATFAWAEAPPPSTPARGEPGDGTADRDGAGRA